MVKLDLVSSPLYLSGTGRVFPQDGQRFVKDCQLYFSSQGFTEELISRNSLSQSCTFPWSCSVPSGDPIDLKLRMTERNAVAEYSSRNYWFESAEMQRRKLDLSRKSDATRITSFPLPNPLDYPNAKFLLKEPFIDYVGELVHNEKIVFGSDGRVLFSGNSAELKHFLSIVGEMYTNKKLRWDSSSLLLVPQFIRNDVQTDTEFTSPVAVSTTTAPTFSTEKVKVKSRSKKRKGKKGSLERDLYKRSYFHTFENFLTLMMNWQYNGNGTRLSLIRSGPEVAMLLGQISAGIAGAGVAVLLFVTCKVACSRVPICESRLLSTGLGFGLVWLSRSVNRLRDTVILIAKNSVKKGRKDAEMIGNVDKRLNEIYLRAAVLMTVAVLKFV